MKTHGYCGWLRLPGHKWRRVCTDALYGEALAQLLKAADAVPSAHKDLVILPAGTDPNTRAVAHARRSGLAGLSFHDAGT